MAMNDPVGDMLTRIRNAQMRRKTTRLDPRLAAARPRARRAAVRRLHPRLHDDRVRQWPHRVRDRAEVLRRRPRSSARSRACRSPAAASTRRSTTMPRVANGLGVTILSTPQGVMADHEAREKNVGGEVLCTVF